VVDELAQIGKARRHMLIVSVVDLQLAAVAIDVDRIRRHVGHRVRQFFQYRILRRRPILREHAAEHAGGGSGEEDAAEQTRVASGGRARIGLAAGHTMAGADIDPCHRSPPRTRLRGIAPKG